MGRFSKSLLNLLQYCLFYVLVFWPRGMWDHSSPTRDQAFFFWLRWVFIAAHGLSLVAESRGYSSLRCAGFSLWWLLLLQSTGSRLTGLVALRHMGSSRTRARTRVPCIGRRILKPLRHQGSPIPILCRHLLSQGA